MSVRNTWLVGLLFIAAACGQEMQGSEAAESGALTASAVSGSQVFGTLIEITSDTPLYNSPDYHSTVIRTLKDGQRARVVRTTSSNGYYLLNYNGKVGWASGAVMKVVLVPDSAIEKGTARAMSAWGFSYHWGGEAWNPESQSPGSCTGNCPDCDHSGSWGADCSGLITKVWKVGGTSCDALTESCGARPTAAAFSGNDPSDRWNNISRDSIHQGDILASSGHVVYYLSGDAWGTPTVLECKGCADGCLKDSRSFSSSYKTSRRSGW